MPRSIGPRTGAPEVTVAEEQEQYMPLVAAVYQDTKLNTPVLLTRWTFTTQERLRIAQGEDLYIAQLTFDHDFTPMQVLVGPEHYLLPTVTPP